DRLLSAGAGRRTGGAAVPEQAGPHRHQDTGQRRALEKTRFLSSAGIPAVRKPAVDAARYPAEMSLTSRVPESTHSPANSRIHLTATNDFCAERYCHWG